MGLFDFIFRKKPKLATAPAQKPREKTQTKDGVDSAPPVPPQKIWIRVTLNAGVPGLNGGAPGSVIAFTYLDPHAGLSAKGGFEGSGNPAVVVIDMTVRLPGGCASWKQISAAERQRLLLPDSPWWVAGLDDIAPPPSHAPMAGSSSPTPFDMAVMSAAEKISQHRAKWEPLHKQAMKSFTAGDLDRAGQLFTQAQQIAEAGGDSFGVAVCVGDRGMVLIQSGDHAKALELYARQEKLCRDHGYAHTFQTCLQNQVNILSKQDDPQALLQKLQELEGLAKDRQNKELIEFCTGIRINCVQPSSDGDRSWRDDPDMAPLFHPDYPDDVMVEFTDPNARITETMWVKIEGAARDSDCYLGRLLNQPHRLRIVSAGDKVVFRKPMGGDPAKFVRKE